MSKVLLELHSQSGSIVPITNGKKSVEGWNKFKSTAASPELIQEWIVSEKYDGYGLMMGYGNFHVIDVDTKNAPDAIRSELFRNIWEGIPDALKDKLTVQRTRNKGEHIIYKSNTPATSATLALNPLTKKKVIETIGSSNYILITPSPGYEVVSGSLSSISSISQADHQWLINHCKVTGHSMMQHHASCTNDTVGSKDNTHSDFIHDAALYLQSTGNDITSNYHDWIKIGYSIANDKGEEGRDYFHMISSNHPEYNEDETNTVYDSAIKGHTTGNRATAASVKHIMKKNGIDTENDENKTSLKTRKSIEHIQSKNLHRNLFTNNVEKSDGAVISECDIDNFYLELRTAGFSISKSDVASIVNSSNIPGINPVKEWMQYAEFYADENAIDELLACLELKESKPELVEFYKCLFLKWLMQIPALIMDKVLPRLVLVLIGESYVGKTQLFRRLLPSELKNYYAESSLDRDKDSDILMTENLLINVDELAGIMKSPKHVERFKAIASSENFTLRVPFGRINERFERKAILCGTSNRPDIVQDHDTSNTRLIPLELVSIDWERFNAIDRRALFGALLKKYYDVGETGLQLTPEDREKLNQQSGDYTVLNMEQELIQRFIYHAEATEENFKTVSEICDFLISRTEQSFEPSKLSRELNRLGFKKDRRRVDGAKSPLYGFYVQYDQHTLQAMFERLKSGDK